MERMRIRVEAVARSRDGKGHTARVSAVALRRVGGRPGARIRLTVALKGRRDEPREDLWRRARDEALQYLDVA